MIVTNATCVIQHGYDVESNRVISICSRTHTNALLDISTRGRLVTPMQPTSSNAYRILPHDLGLGCTSSNLRKESLE